MTKACQTKFGLNSPLGGKEFMPFIDNDTFEVGQFFPCVLVGQKERKRLGRGDEGVGEFFPQLCLAMG